MSKQKVAKPRHSSPEGFTTVVRSPIRYAVIEMGDYEDVKVFEKQLEKACRPRKTENISPQSYRGKTFKKSLAAWKDYRQDIVDGKYSGRSSAEPDWWYWSGHHANFGDGKYYGERGQYGLFNEPYYAAWKDYIYKQKEPDKKQFPGEIENAVFMVTSAFNSDLEAGQDHQKESNPVYVKDPCEACKGVMLIGCNTLTGIDCQDTLLIIFPNALIFGYYYAKAPGGKAAQKKHIEAIFKAPKRAQPSLFSDPEGFLSKAGGAEEVLKTLVGKLSRRTRKRRLACCYQKQLFVPEYNWMKKVWFHRYGFFRYMGDGRLLSSSLEHSVLCPVPGKKNPFHYEKATRFIVGSDSERARVVPHFRYSEIAGLPAFSRVDTYLLMILDNFRSVSKGAVVLKAISKSGTWLELESQAPDQFMQQAENSKRVSDLVFTAKRHGKSDRITLEVG